MCRSPFHALLCATLPIALVAAFFHGNLLPMMLWIPVTFTAVAFAARRKK